MEAWAQKRLLECGSAIYEPLQPEQRVKWPAHLLAFCMRRSPSVPAIAHVAALARVPADWRLAHAAFSDVRKVTLVAERRDEAFEPCLKSLLYVAENTAKVIYNASNASALFDHDAGWWMVPCFKHFLATVAEPEVTDAGVRLLFASD